LERIVTRSSFEYARHAPRWTPAATISAVIGIYSALQAGLGFSWLWLAGALRLSLIPPMIGRTIDIAASQYWLVVALCAAYGGAFCAVGAGLICMLQHRRVGFPALILGLAAVSTGAIIGTAMLVSGAGR